MEFKRLVGRKIIGLYGDKDTLQFETDEGVITYGCEGDCCSSSWFEHVSGVEVLVGHTVTKAETIGMPDIPQEDVWECVQAYGFQLLTDKGHFLIEMRNLSNGYYGGNITGPTVGEAVTAPKIESDW